MKRFGFGLIFVQSLVVFFIPLYERAERRMNMEFLKWYLIVGVIVNIIAEIYNVKKYEGDSFTGIIIDTWKAEKSIMARSKLIIEYICVFMIACILWLPAIVFGIVYVIKERLNK